ncbi:MAG: uracil-DNA glycosylase [Betaproteobacteria bacterium]|nr:uracil-DNA glycosylase [Betaproteobacteria bacterium]
MGLVPVWRIRTGDVAASPVPPPALETKLAPGFAASPAPPPALVTKIAARVATIPDADARERAIRAMGWAELKRAVPDCSACALHRTRTQTVFGIGDENADWMLVGEAPGAEEDRLGEPFVGQAGRLLDNMLAAIRLKRGENVYIANVLKCRPPANRNPEPDEVARCSPHLVRQIELIRPKLIVAMGRFAAQALLNSNASIASMRGRVHRYQGVPTIVTYHPAYLLRSLPDKSKAWADLLFAVRTLRELKQV